MLRYAVLDNRRVAVFWNTMDWCSGFVGHVTSVEESGLIVPGVDEDVPSARRDMECEKHKLPDYQNLYKLVIFKHYRVFFKSSLNPINSCTGKHVP